MNRSYVDHLVMNNDKLLYCMTEILELCSKDISPLSKNIGEIIGKTLDELDPLDEVM